MEITFVTSYYPPEIGAAANRIKNMAEAFAENYDKVNVISPLPNYPKGRIFEDFRGRFFATEVRQNITIYRYWIYPSVSKNILKRIVSMFSFALTLWFYLTKFRKIRRSKWIIIQNSPLLVSFSSIVLFKYIFRRKIALNVSDLWPLSALELGVVKKGKFYSFLEWLERFNYRNSDLIIGQSNEILGHVNEIVKKNNFLYRNLQRNGTVVNDRPKQFKNFKLVYAGLLGVAQGVYEIVRNIDFKKMGIEFHIYGNGNELIAIQKFLDENSDTNIQYKGSLPKNKLVEVLPNYHASIVPLRTSIKGAVPSKIFELIKLEIPILLLANGEASDLIKNWGVGYTSDPQDFSTLKKNIETIFKSENNYRNLCRNCKIISENQLNFDSQIDNLLKLLK